jgi:mono/diheme cytochrome c family protein
VKKQIVTIAAVTVVAAATFAGTAGAAARATDPGLKVFTTAGCAACHTLAAAKATGKIGPNLDTLKPSMAAVSAQVIKGGGAMPSFKKTLSAAQIKAVAMFVSMNAGKK